MDNSPPPAYSEQELDQKIDSATQLSLQDLQTAQSREDEWEEWNEAAFQAAEAAAKATRGSQRELGSSSNLRALPTPPSNQLNKAGSPSSSVAPLHIRKKPQQLETLPSKARPSWLSEAEAPHARGSTVHGSTAGPSSGHHFSLQHEQSFLADNDDDRSIPPPPFSPIGPSLDGPPFEELRLAYRGNESRSPSPLASPTASEHPPFSSNTVNLALQSTQSNSHHTPQNMMPGAYANLHHRPLPSRYSLPVSPQPTHSYQQNHRPQTTFIPSGQMPAFLPPNAKYDARQVPHVDFNPSMAYQKREEHMLPVQRAPPPPNVYNASAFYNSAVSAHLVQPSTPPRSSRAGLKSYSPNLPSVQDIQTISPSPSHARSYSQQAWDGLRNPSPAVSSDSHSSMNGPGTWSSPLRPTSTYVPDSMSNTSPYTTQYSSPQTYRSGGQQWATSDQQQVGRYIQ